MLFLNYHVKYTCCYSIFSQLYAKYIVFIGKFILYRRNSAYQTTKSIFGACLLPCPVAFFLFYLNSIIGHFKGNWIVRFPLETGDTKQNQNCENLLDSHLLNSAVKQCIVLISSIFLMQFSGSHRS